VVLDCDANRDLWYSITTTSSLASPAKQLVLLDKLGPTTEVNPAAEVPFEFDVLDTPNKGIAIAVTKLALAGEEYNTGVSKRSIESLKAARKWLEEGTAGLPQDIDAGLVPPIVRDEWTHNIDTLLTLCFIKNKPHPPITMTMDQYKELTNHLSTLYRTASKIRATSRWRDDVLAWTKRQTMRVLAHHLEHVLRIEMNKIGTAGPKDPIWSTETIAKRQCEVIVLLESSGFTDDSIYKSTKQDFDLGYRMDLGAYKPILTDQITSGKFYVEKDK
jgi:hypothetical protein